ncbi:MAG: hypothetical protein C0513_06330 [Isosphaera sp.]|nr:hypothetical protein [Isosphaera sp.]
MLRTALFIVLVLGSVGVAGYAAVAYALLPVGSTVHPQMQAVYEQHRVAILAHIAGSMAALLIGPAQFISGLRARQPRVHRVLGRLYLLGVLVGGVAGLRMAMLAFGGIVAHTGFALLAALWLWTGARALLAARAGRIAEHRRWMIRNFALTFAAVTLRAQLGLFAALGFAFESYYPVLAWISWVPNLMVAQWLVRPPRRCAATPAGLMPTPASPAAASPSLLSSPSLER